VRTGEAFCSVDSAHPTENFLVIGCVAEKAYFKKFFAKIRRRVGQLCPILNAQLKIKKGPDFSECFILVATL
jgi:hypothetical protein